MLLQGVLAEDLSTTFSLNSMRIFLDLYFMHFAPLHPILHQSTLALRPGGISPYLLAAVCCIGSAYAEEKSGWKAAVRLSKRLRNRILEIVEENPRIDMDMLKVQHLTTLALRCVQTLKDHPLPFAQTLMLVNWFGRYFCSATLHDVSQVRLLLLFTVLSSRTDQSFSSSGLPLVIHHPRRVLGGPRP